MSSVKDHKKAYQYTILSLIALVLVFELISFCSTGWVRFEGIRRTEDERQLTRNRRSVAGKDSNGRSGSTSYQGPEGKRPGTTSSGGGSGLGIQGGQEGNENSGGMTGSGRPRQPNRGGLLGSGGSEKTNGPDLPRSTKNPKNGESKRPNGPGTTGKPGRPNISGMPRPTGKPGRPNVSGMSRPTGKPGRPNISGMPRPTGKPGRPNVSGMPRPTGKPGRPNISGMPRPTGKPGRPTKPGVPEPTRNPVIDGKGRSKRPVVPLPTNNPATGGNGNEGPSRSTSKPSSQKPVTCPSIGNPGLSMPNLNNSGVGKQVALNTFINFILCNLNTSWSVNKTVNYIVKQMSDYGKLNDTQLDSFRNSVTALVTMVKRRGNDINLYANLLKRLIKTPSLMFKGPAITSADRTKRTLRPRPTRTTNKPSFTMKPRLDVGDSGALAGGNGENISEKVSIDIGLWSATICEEVMPEGERVCLKMGHDFNQLLLDTNEWSMADVQVEAVLAGIFGVLGAIATSLMMQPWRLQNKKTALTICGVCGLVLSGMLYLVSIARAVRLNTAFKEQARREYVSFEMKMPWCLVVGGMAAGFAFVISALLVTSKWIENRKNTWSTFSDEIVFTKEAENQPGTEA